MEERIGGGLIKGAIDSIPIEKNEKILDQMKNCVCKINGNKIGTGFFCKIPYKNQIIPILMTTYYIIDDNFIESEKQIIISINKKEKIIKINNKSKIYSSIEYNLMLIQLSEEEKNDYNYLELDDNILLNNSELLYKESSIYILYYSNTDNISLSFGLGIEKQNKYDIKHLCNTDLYSSGGPILSLTSNKVIGIHKGCIGSILLEGDIIYNIGTYLKYPLIELNNRNDSNKIKKNEINMNIRINKDEINEKIYFLDNTKGNVDNKGIEHYHDYLKELNKLNTELYINNIRYEYNKYFIPKKEGIYSIKLKFNIVIRDCSYMFFNIPNLLFIDFFSFDASNITNMSFMFSGCSSIDYLMNISNFDTKNVTDMSCLFYGCISLYSLPDISKWDTKNVTDMCWMFRECISLESLPDISKWDTKKVTNMNSIFYNCCSLNSLPDISKWDTKNVNDMNSIFFRCYSLISLPDVSKWDTKNVDNIKDIFNGCSQINSLPDISNWDTKNIRNMNGIFCGCCRLSSLPDISKWVTNNVTNMSFIFYRCCSLNSLPDISKWETKNVTDMRGIFRGCNSLNSLPDISKWNTKMAIDMSWMFDGCFSLIYVPDVY